MKNPSRFLGDIIFSSRWLLYPINFGLLAALLVYIGNILIGDCHIVLHPLQNNNEELMVLIIGLVDMSMVANLVMMIAQGNHQIFIHKFELKGTVERPQWLDHIDSGILKVKVALSIAGITLIQLLKDFVNIEHMDWNLTMHRVYIHIVCLCSALMMSLIWRVTHPQPEKHHEK